jgi:hypothetical protein
MVSVISRRVERTRGGLGAGAIGAALGEQDHVRALGLGRHQPGGNPLNYIVRHMNLDPGVLAAEDQLANLQAVREGTRVFSAYELRDGTRIWIITEADRSVTTILPEEY